VSERKTIMTEISNSKGFRFMEGRFRIVREPDGLFVVGEGLILPVDSCEQGLELIREIEEKAGS
jgi:hypothetical protein